MCFVKWLFIGIISHVVCLILSLTDNLTMKLLSKNESVIPYSGL